MFFVYLLSQNFVSFCTLKSITFTFFFLLVSDFQLLNLFIITILESAWCILFCQRQLRTIRHRLPTSCFFLSSDHVTEDVEASSCILRFDQSGRTISLRSDHCYILNTNRVNQTKFTLLINFINLITVEVHNNTKTRVLVHSLC